MIKVINLVKNYKEIQAVKNISFEVEEGSFFAFLGPNGAGKSTTINIISTLLEKTSGEVIVNGNKVDENDSKIRNDIGVVLQDGLLDPLLTIKENILIRGSLYKLSRKVILKRLKSLADKIGVTEYQNRKYGELSGGQRRRADIVRALINHPKILILDEPTTGLDPHTRQKVWQTIKNLQEENNITVFLTTHYMDETLGADKVVIINNGIIAASGTPESLRLQYSIDVLNLIPKDIEQLSKKLSSMKIVFSAYPDLIKIKIKDSLASIDIINAVKDDIAGFEVIRGNMDDVFINVTGNKLDEEEASL